MKAGSGDLSLDTAEALIWFARRYPAAAICVAVSIILIAFIVVTLEKQKPPAVPSAESVTYEKQIKELGQTEASIKSLLAFVESERQRIKDNEKLIESLQSRHNELKPVVEADEKTVRALFDAQAKITAENATWQWWSAFGQGVIASLLASLLYSLATWSIKRVKIKKIPVTPPEESH